MSDFEAAKDKVYMGPERRSRSMTEADKKIIAYHEAGHAVVGLFTEGSDPLHKITIVPRGRALGLTWQLPETDRYLSDKGYLEGEIRILMGGRLAEELFVGKISTGASNDIQRATSLARKMVCDYGMSKLGPIHYGDNQQQLFLGRDIGSQRETSEDTARMIDAEVKRIVDENYSAARQLLEEHRREMELLTSALLEYESLEASDVKELFEKGEISRPKPVKDVPTEPVKPSTEVVSDAPAVPDQA
jgi:cell division protease FtsH